MADLSSDAFFLQTYVIKVYLQKAFYHQLGPHYPIFPLFLMGGNTPIKGDLFSVEVF
jgi:hypothetical protein